MIFQPLPLLEVFFVLLFAHCGLLFLLPDLLFLFPDQQAQGLLVQQLLVEPHVEADSRQLQQTARLRRQRLLQLLPRYDRDRKGGVDLPVVPGEDLHILSRQDQRVRQKRLPAHDLLISLRRITVVLEPVHAVDNIDVESVKQRQRLLGEFEHFSLREACELPQQLVLLLLEHALCLLALGKFPVRRGEDPLHVPLLS